MAETPPTLPSPASGGGKGGGSAGGGLGRGERMRPRHQLLAGGKTKRFENRPGRQCQARMGDKDAELRQNERGREYFTDAAHNARPRIKADRNIRAGGARR